MNPWPWTYEPLTMHHDSMSLDMWTPVWPCKINHDLGHTNPWPHTMCLWPWTYKLMTMHNESWPWTYQPLTMHHDLVHVNPQPRTQWIMTLYIQTPYHSQWIMTLYIWTLDHTHNESMTLDIWTPDHKQWIHDLGHINPWPCTMNPWPWTSKPLTTHNKPTIMDIQTPDHVQITMTTWTWWIRRRTMEAHDWTMNPMNSVENDHEHWNPNNNHLHQKYLSSPFSRSCLLPALFSTSVLVTTTPPPR